MTPGIERVLKRCLAKDPHNRWQTARDLKAELDWLSSAPAESEVVEAPPRLGRRIAWIVAAALSVLLAIAGWVRPRTAPGDLPRWQLSIVPPEGEGFGAVGGQSSNPEISPDGSTLLFRGRGGLYLRRLDSLAVQLLPGTAGAFQPFWSPDSARSKRGLAWQKKSSAFLIAIRSPACPAGVGPADGSC